MNLIPNNHQHGAALVGVGFSLISGAQIIQSIIVGVSVYLITSLIKHLPPVLKFLWGKIRK